MNNRFGERKIYENVGEPVIPTISWHTVVAPWERDRHATRPKL